VTSGPLTRGSRILRSAPWLPLLGAAAAAAVLLLVAVVAHRTGIGPLIALLGLTACGAAAAYILDEEAAAVLDATPTSRARRVLWRLPLAALPAAVALVGLLTLDHLDGASHWLRLVPLAAGSLAIGVAFAAALRSGSAGIPGDLASVLTLASVMLIVTVDPLHRWVTLAPLGDATHVGRSVLLWAAVIVGCGAVTVAHSRDPARRARRNLWHARVPSRAGTVLSEPRN
jgi:hypothetical protein